MIGQCENWHVPQYVSMCNKEISRLDIKTVARNAGRGPPPLGNLPSPNYY